MATKTAKTNPTPLTDAATPNTALLAALAALQSACTHLSTGRSINVGDFRLTVAAGELISLVRR